MSDDHRMSPDGEYIQYQMENPGIHDAPAPTGDGRTRIRVDCDGCGTHAWAKNPKMDSVAPAPADVEEKLTLNHVLEEIRAIVTSQGGLFRVDDTDVGDEVCIDGRFPVRVLAESIAAARAEERERVWKMAHELADYELCRRDCAGGIDIRSRIYQAALADGIDLTSLSKPE